jgi:hypothetical protein
MSGDRGGRASSLRVLGAAPGRSRQSRGEDIRRVDAIEALASGGVDRGDLEVCGMAAPSPCVAQRAAVLSRELPL